MNAHKYADLFPLMDGDELDELTNDIKLNGQLMPIWTYNGEVLDGRNRWAACNAAGISPEIKVYTGDDPLGFVVAINLRRRHMNFTQRAMLGAELKSQYTDEARERRLVNLKQGEEFPEPPTSAAREVGDSRDRAAAAVGVSHGYIDMAAQIKEKAPEMVDDVLRGEVPLLQARAISKVPARSVRTRVMKRVLKETANFERTKRIISDETKTKPPADKPKNPDDLHFSWKKDPDVTQAEDGWSDLFKQSERMANTGQQPVVARSVLNRWVRKAQNFVEAFDE